MRTIVGHLGTRFDRVGRTRMFYFRPTVVPKCKANGTIRLCVRSGAKNSVRPFCRSMRGFVVALGRHPRITVTCDSCTVGFPRVTISMSTAGYGHTKVDPDSILSIIKTCYKNSCMSGCGGCKGMCHIVVRTSPSTHLGRRTLSGVFIHGKARVTPIDRFIALHSILNPRVTGHFGLCGAVSIGIGITRKCSANRIRGTVGRITTRMLPSNCNCRCKNVTHRRTDDKKTRAIFVCALYIMLVCLVLSYLCRDFLIPLTMVLSIPFKLVKDFLFTHITKLRGGVCLRANTVVLVNLLTGATVLVARCTVRHHHGNVNVVSSTCSTTRTHFHPVVVAILYVVFNVLPLVFSSNTKTGKGDSLTANMMKNVLVNALTLLFIIPIFFIIFRCLRRGLHNPVRGRPSRRVLCRGRRALVRGDTFGARGWVGGVGASGVVTYNTALLLDDYKVCADCRPRASIPRGLCNRRIAISSATDVKGVR